MPVVALTSDVVCTGHCIAFLHIDCPDCHLFEYIFSLILHTLAKVSLLYAVADPGEARRHPPFWRPGN